MCLELISEPKNQSFHVLQFHYIKIFKVLKNKLNKYIASNYSLGVFGVNRPVTIKIIFQLISFILKKKNNHPYRFLKYFRFIRLS